MSALLDAHEGRGKTFSVGGLKSFVLDEGEGDLVVCLHGVPVSSYVYRRLVRELAEAGLRGVAFDYPGAGLTERPSSFDYSWTRLGRYAVEALDALGIDRGEDDPALRLDVHGSHIKALVGDEHFYAVPGLHFVQETQAPFIAERVAAVAM